MSNTYWKRRNAVPMLIAPLITSAVLATRETTVPATTAPWTAHHIPRNADSRRTEVTSGSGGVLHESPHRMTARTVRAEIL